MNNEENACDPNQQQPTGTTNGLNFCGSTLPENVVELILTKVEEEDIFNCTLVCQAWSNLIATKSYWKKRFENTQVNWNNVMRQILERPGRRTAFNAVLQHKILSKNFIKNSSGHDQFEGWTIVPIHAFLFQWRIEEEPIDCNPLPDLPLFGVKDRSCFVATSFWCSKYYLVDLWAEGLTPNLMKQLQPFKIKCSQSYTASPDLGGEFDWELMLLNSQEKVLSEYMSATTSLLPGSVDWRTAEYAFHYGTSNAIHLQDLRYVLFIHEGRNFEGEKRCVVKLSRSCVTIECLESEFEVNETEQTLQSMGVRDRYDHIMERKSRSNLFVVDPVPEPPTGLFRVIMLEGKVYLQQIK